MFTYQVGSFRVVGIADPRTLGCDDCNGTSELYYLVVGASGIVHSLCDRCTFECAYLTGTNDEQRMQAHVSNMVGAHA